MKITLYKKDNTGKVRSWTIWNEENIISMEYGYPGGKMQLQTEVVEENQSGRSLEEQTKLRMASRIGRQRDKGYVTDSANASLGTTTNQLNMPMPMLAQKYKSKTPDSYYLQKKYDGNRCMIAKMNGRVFAYTRNGKEIKSIEHILESAKDIPEGTILDGELYHHGTALQTLRSWITKRQLDSKNIVHMCYDIVQKHPYSKRLRALKSLTLGPSIKLAETELISKDFSLSERLGKVRAEGYEGLIIRLEGTGYEDGKRSHGLLKVKVFMDTEVLVHDIVKSREGWAILVCGFNNEEFRVSCPGTMEFKRIVADNPDKYIGCKVTVEYANLTKGGVPFHPTAIAFRS